MKKYLTLLFFLLFTINASATTYLTYWVNDSEADSAIQGDNFAWEYDVSQVGGSAMVSIYTDINEDGIIDDDDVLHISFTQTDGDVSSEGPADSSATPDGIVYSLLGSFGFAPGYYIFHIEDQQDQSAVAEPFILREIESVTTITGTVSIENISTPNDSLAYIMIIAEPDDMGFGFWSGLTDAYGNYTINLPDDAPNTPWRIGLLSDDFQMQGYIVTPSEYEDETITTGENSAYDFLLSPSSTIVYGNVYDEQGQSVIVNDYGYLENQNMGEGNSFMIFDGAYTAYAMFAENDTVDVPFQMHFDGDNFIPEYLIPNTWNNDYYRFNLSIGDSIRKDITLIETDTVIHVYVTQDGETPGANYLIVANTDSGHTRANTNGNGYARLSIKNGFSYYINIDEEENQPTLPPGYIVEDGNARTASAGDTVRFNLIPSESLLAGRLIFEEGDQQYINFDEFEAEASTESTHIRYSGQINENDSTFEIHVPNGEYYVKVNNWPIDFLSMPAEWNHITVSSDTIDTLDFEMAYTHAQLKIQLRNVPESVFNDWRWWGINTTGEYPWIYQTYAEIQSDTSYYFRVCDGDWYIAAPYLGDDYVASIEDTTIIVTDSESEYELIIAYHNENTNLLEADNYLPTEFIVKQNYPNPFNPLTNFEFGLPRRSHVILEVYTISGEKVATLIDGQMSAGMHYIPWNAAHLASGMYIFRLRADQKTDTKKMLLIK